MSVSPPQIPMLEFKPQSDGIKRNLARWLGHEGINRISTLIKGIGEIVPSASFPSEDTAKCHFEEENKPSPHTRSAGTFILEILGLPRFQKL